MTIVDMAEESRIMHQLRKIHPELLTYFRDHGKIVLVFEDGEVPKSAYPEGSETHNLILQLERVFG